MRKRGAKRKPLPQGGNGFAVELLSNLNQDRGSATTTSGQTGKAEQGKATGRGNAFGHERLVGDDIVNAGEAEVDRATQDTATRTATQRILKREATPQDLQIRSVVHSTVHRQSPSLCSFLCPPFLSLDILGWPAVQALTLRGGVYLCLRESDLHLEQCS